jgi:hypothetical protein
MGSSNAERQQRWQARNLVKLTASADEIAAKLIAMPDQAKLRRVHELVTAHLGARHDAPLINAAVPAAPPGPLINDGLRRVTGRRRRQQLDELARRDAWERKYGAANRKMLVKALGMLGSEYARERAAAAEAAQDIRRRMRIASWGQLIPDFPAVAEALARLATGADAAETAAEIEEIRRGLGVTWADALSIAIPPRTPQSKQK